MEKFKNFIQLTTVLAFVVMALGSGSSSHTTRSYINEENYRELIQKPAQEYVQTSQGGTYVGDAETQQDAYNMAKEAGYSKYQWYPSTGRCYGYN